ncbi:LysR family transcriptional regulator [Paracidovorax wautersii]|uniref:DNA-binding transcriptional LysR family regulator n=1 Tax=Paracidovorax wautersii TaxID=1177982 RepID=A0ABU1ID84_9BURK|nr:LysR family transcriptional regulator [Paracidovorax wautersii]MDR6214911.1 DNA-binding transcriptional LysR family regulator [Paracidovorax wautersii]
MLSSRLQETALRYFLEVVRSGSVSEAATRLNVSPSAVSRQVAALEDLLGVPLFDRRPRGMAPSPAGELLAAHARRGALEADRVVSDIQALQGVHTGLIRLSSSAGFAIEFLPRVMAQFRVRYPGMQFRLSVASPAAVTVAVLNGDADVGLTYSRSAERDITVQHREASPVIAIMRPDHPLARFPSVTLAQMHAHPIALPERDNTVRQLFDIGCSQRGLVFEPALVCNHFETLTHFVLHGGGLSISGEVTVRDRVARGELHAAQIRERGMSARLTEIQTLSGRTLPLGVRLFLDYLRSALPAPSG